MKLKETLFFMIFFLVVACTSKDATSYYQIGLKHQSNGDYSRSITDFSQALALDNSFFDAYIARANSYDLLGDYESASNDFSAAIKNNPNDPRGYYGRGRISIIMGNYQDAIGDMDKAIDLNPHYEEAYIEISRAYMELGEYSLAEVRLTNAIDLGISNLGIFFSRGRIRLVKKDFTGAIEDLKEAIEIDEEYTEAYLGLGYSFYGLEDYENALFYLNLYVGAVGEKNLNPETIAILEIVKRRSQ